MANVYSNKIIDSIIKDLEFIISSSEMSSSIEDLKGYIKDLNCVINELEDAADLDDIITDIPLYLNFIDFRSGSAVDMEINKRKLYKSYKVD